MSEIIYYCEQGDPNCISPKCRCNTRRRTTETRGGKRENAGAKPKGNVIYYRRVSPLHVALLDNYLKQLKNGEL